MSINTHQVKYLYLNQQTSCKSAKSTFVGKGKRLKGKGKIPNLSPFTLPLFPTSARSLTSEKAIKALLGFVKSSTVCVYPISCTESTAFMPDFSLASEIPHRFY